MKNVDLTKDAVKIIRISFSYIKAIQNELNFFLNISSFKIMEDAKAFTWRKDYSIQITSYIKNYLFFHFDSVPNSIVDELIKTQKKKKKKTFYGTLQLLNSRIQQLVHITKIVS